MRMRRVPMIDKVNKLEFEAVLIRPAGIGTWTYLTVPYLVEEVFGSKAQVRVKGTVNDVIYHGSLMPHGDGQHYMVVNKSIREAIKAEAGSLVRVTMELDTELREVHIPEDFLSELEANVDATTHFNNLAYSHQKEYVTWIEAAKKPETRTNRIAKAIEKLGAGLKLK
jgi:hypothetical protein